MSTFGWVLAGLIVGSLAFWLWRGRTIQATECGHKTKIQGEITALGETVRMKLPLWGGKTKYCHACLGTMTVRCAWCSAPIFIGDRVTLYLADKDRPLPEGAKEYFHEGGYRSFVGCLRCSDGWADAQGIWYPPGVVHRIPSGTEIALAAFRQGASAVILHR